MPSNFSVSSGRGHSAAHHSRLGMLVDGNMIGSAFAPYEGVAKHFELACIWFALRAGKRVNGRTDPNIHKATILDHPLPGCTRQTTGNSGRPEIDVGYGRCRDRLAIGDVCELQMAARLEHAMYFARTPAACRRKD